MKLSQLKIGDKAKIVKFDCKTAITNRLNVLGLNVDDEIKIIQVAPFNSPIEILVGDFYLAIRKSVCEKITVKIL